MSLRLSRAAFKASIGVQELGHHLVQSKLPFPLHFGRELVSHWSALTTWTLDDDLEGLKRDVGIDKSVEVELGKKGRGYLDKETSRVSMPFGLFIDAFLLNRIPSGSSATEIPSAYLAQSDILDSSPGLLDRIPPLEQYESGPQASLYRRTMWIGPKGSFTPFHRDPYHGIYTQILGNKTFHLVPPSAAKDLKLSTNPLQKNTSTVPSPVSEYFSTQSPSAEGEIQIERRRGDHLSDTTDALIEALRCDGSCVAQLGPGQSVLIPEGWYHSAEGGDGPGVGVNAWFR
ncbi:hypothetical protein BD324DRAFT_626374 [Kockovaella imperatae]|uniref:JmjC domain-containing protein n=1 Tax=Kockovaella imperatae TaxID=4999 RepID=A0A1Y1UGB4_9TREE|nr:hypothetical protein BD324DRAFT_626374 [Kockovaella imperatae]ORX36577.1 hypothetical protein BD324DRAFT_626374 [Kockovaella imperatae]